MGRLDIAYTSAAFSEIPRFGREWDGIYRGYKRLEFKASVIRQRNFEADSWNKYVGFNPCLVSDIVEWYEDAERLEKRIAIAVEADIQTRYEAGNSSYHSRETVQTFVPAEALGNTSNAYAGPRHISETRSSLAHRRISVPVNYIGVSESFSHSSSFSESSTNSSLDQARN
ncbi:40S ribosomal protein S6 [Marasmius crinis-equi]|uniref:40S ribosomal protein S6 n=1 Tax=Marasmius crinis-equi TaxID=585013 RepID=A0ABR3FB29_9AGAR